MACSAAAGAAVLSLLGTRTWAAGVTAVCDLLGSRTLMLQLAYSLLDSLLLALVPEAAPVLHQLRVEAADAAGTHPARSRGT